MHKLSSPWEGLSSLLKLSAHRLTVCNGAMEKECQTLGTWSIYDDSIHSSFFQPCIYVLCTFLD
jgi:hypothetical protein